MDFNEIPLNESFDAHLNAGLTLIQDGYYSLSALAKTKTGKTEFLQILYNLVW